ADLTRLRARYGRATGRRKESLARQLQRAERAALVAALDGELASVAARRRELVSARRSRDLFGDRYAPTAEERALSRELRVRAGALRARRRRIATGGALPFSWPAHFADIAERGGFG